MAEPDIQVYPPPGKLNTIYLTRAPPLPAGEASLDAQTVAWVERRGVFRSAHGAGELLCPGSVLSVCYLLQTSSLCKIV